MITIAKPLATLICAMCTIFIPTQCTFGREKPANAEPSKKKPHPEFRWVNPLPQGNFPGVKHATFRSPSMKVDVGYCICLPPQYRAGEHQGRRFPVIYFLHGGRPGNESKSVRLTRFIHTAISEGTVPPAIYVFVNGGRVSHYNTPQFESMGEDVFVKELIPHIDAAYRTIATRAGRGLEGFSQGGRGTARIMFKYPHLFCSAAAGGAGYATEKRISEENGYENPFLKFAAGDNTYDLARKYATKGEQKLPILIYVGDKGFNYQNNLEYMKFLDELKIPHQRLIVKGAAHSTHAIYEKHGLDIMKFHANNFQAADVPAAADSDDR